MEKASNEIKSTQEITMNLLESVNELSDLFESGKLENGKFCLDYKATLDAVHNIQVAAHAAAEKLNAVVKEDKTVLDMFCGE